MAEAIAELTEEEYSPLKVLNVTRTTYTVGDFLAWQRSRALLLSPSFQRRPVWSKPAKSYLVDSMIRGLPVPIVYLRGRVNLSDLQSQREIVDGQQRLRTILGFIEPAALPDYNPERDSFTVQRTHNKDKKIYGKQFPQFPDAVKRQILAYEFSVHVLPPDIDDREVLQIFARLNSTGVKLNHQELRNAEFFGEFKTAAYDLAYQQLDRWRRWRVFDENQIARMDEVELTSELMILMLEGVRGKTQSAVTRIYRENDAQFLEEVEIRRRFANIMDHVDDLVGPMMPRLEFSRPPLFHTLFSFIYDLTYGLESPLSKQPPRKLPTNLVSYVDLASQIIAGGDMPEMLSKALRGATSDRLTRTVRLDFLKNVYQGAAS